MITDAQIKAARQATGCCCSSENMRAALEAAEAAAWQSIKTAALDGSQYLIYFPNGDMWGAEYDSIGTGDWWPPGIDDPVNCATQNRTTANEPTHWRPLTAPPKGEPL